MNMPKIRTVIYRRPNENCPLCVRISKRNPKDNMFDFRCVSVGVYGKNYHNAEWVMGCPPDKKWKKCSGVRWHKRLLKNFKRLLLEVSTKTKTGSRFLPIDSVGDRLKPRELSACLDYYGFKELIKTKKNRKKKMWKRSEAWYVRKASG